MSPVLVEVDLRSGVRALASVLSVLHARGARIADLTYRSGEGGAALDITVDGSAGEVDLLVRQLLRRVDVVDAHIAGEPGSCCVATRWS